MNKQQAVRLAIAALQAEKQKISCTASMQDIYRFNVPSAINAGATGNIKFQEDSTLLAIQTDRFNASKKRSRILEAIEILKGLMA